VKFVEKFANLIGRIIGPCEWLGTLSLDVLKHLATVGSKAVTDWSRRSRKTHTVKKPEKIEDGFALRLWRSVDDVANSCDLRCRSSIENYFFVVHFLIVSQSFSEN
jgi:hypothetical protein